MKKLLPFMFIYFLAFTGCKDDDEADPKTLSDQLQGKWTIMSQKDEYYNASNAKIFEETTPGGGGGTVTFTGSNVDIAGGGITFNGTYTANETNGKKILGITLLGSTDNIEITTLTDKNMTWVSEEQNVMYEENGTQKTAAKSITTVQLQK